MELEISKRIANFADVHIADCSIAGTVLVCRGTERAKPNGKALDLAVDLCP